MIASKKELKELESRVEKLETQINRDTYESGSRGDFWLPSLFGFGSYKRPTLKVKVDKILEHLRLDVDYVDDSGIRSKVKRKKRKK